VWGRLAGLVGFRHFSCYGVASAPPLKACNVTSALLQTKNKNVAACSHLERESRPIQAQADKQTDLRKADVPSCHYRPRPLSQPQWYGFE
jgi:hypothetical protein